ncbi:hypothetical protein A8924_5448 [Saccharopolyspora erythraea NRRL 2338]|uniref:Uncharacterized protein n=1 Tax=Saccharopolyspora erythraea (strain ATCC 11635 / DSM 40517 / JCM 4748 / NBRC 13426 / NCIMB 8594 / NRRL 2338) TaxID=405948 RepID=A4FJU9_SACEN|nr:hypothetical protein [Saccharopolyspora erythraea]PFG97965.1 hypothetical protein A8924_5448 [Saccharopolyspora erythraea NRRL 2338]QRK88090.1 hypothetical protein JQX30_25680 [Saccharopolyspora erythraea]CAM04324.1 hypothetical protein SACE_5064 [Saccharopolyspora erythraea NRRL 2338]
MTQGEIRRLFNRITRPVRHSIDHILHWSAWRRTSQHRTRTSHYRRHHNLSLQ